jgi:hypothetical protein
MGMQVINQFDQVAFSKIGEMKSLEKEAEEIRAKKEAKEVNVAELPNLGEIIFHRGLRFMVKSIHSRGRLTIQLI